MKYGWAIAGGVILIGGAGAYYYYTGQIKAIKELEFQIVGYKVVGIATLDEAKIQLTIRLINKSAFEVKVLDFFVDVYLDDKKISNLEPVEPFLVPSKDFSGKPNYSDANIIIKFSPKLLGLNALGFITNYLTKKDMNIRVVGSAKLKSSFVTLTVPVEYNTTLTEILSPTT